MGNRVEETGGTPMGKEAATSADYNNSFTSAVSATGNLIAEQAYKNVVVSANYENEDNIAAENYSVALGTKSTVNTTDTNATFSTDKYVLTPAFDLSTTSYDSKTFDVSTQGTSTQGLSFKSDGTKMYVLTASSQIIFQYTLSTPWDVSTASYDSKSLNISSEADQPKSLFLNSDGTKLYFSDSFSDSIFQYTLSTPFDLSTGSYDSKSYNASSESPDMRGIFFKTDGTKMYINDNTNDAIYQYTLSTAFDVSTATYDIKTFDFTTQNTNPDAVFITDDGIKMYITLQGTGRGYQYTLSTAWDISTAVYSGKNFSFAAQSAFPKELIIRPDGTKLYIVDSNGTNVYQYSLGSIVLCDANTLAVTDDTNSFALFWKGDLASDVDANFNLSDGTNSEDLPVNNATKHTGAILKGSLTNLADVKITQSYSTSTGVTSSVDTQGWGLSRL